jgi:hypothetical protein
MISKRFIALLESWEDSKEKCDGRTAVFTGKAPSITLYVARHLSAVVARP